MSDADNPIRDEDQLAAVSTDYRGLLATTRPLVIEQHTLQSWRGGEICRSGFGISPEPRHWYGELTLKRGEIVCPGESATGNTDDEGQAAGREDATAEAIFTQRQSDSNLQIRICLGMS